VTPPPGRGATSIRFAGVAKRFDDLVVLDGVDLEVRSAEVLALVGPSGCGKSTLLRLVNGLEIRDAGKLEVLGTAVPLGPPAARGDDPFWLPLRRRIGFVFQAFHLYPHLGALENVALAPRRVLGLAPEEARGRARALLARVGLAEKETAMPRQLSGGQQQRVAIARALAMEPEILLFDEPTSALDPEMSAEVNAVIRSLAEEHERTLVVVTHDFDFARATADRIAFLEGGRIVEVGPAREVLENPKEERTRRFLERVR
jgi:ABC-type polar amino acid transport system ATPase subunit